MDEEAPATGVVHSSEERLTDDERRAFEKVAAHSRLGDGDLADPPRGPDIGDGGARPPAAAIHVEATGPPLRFGHSDATVQDCIAREGPSAPPE